MPSELLKRIRHGDLRWYRQRGRWDIVVAVHRYPDLVFGFHARLNIFHPRIRSLNFTWAFWRWQLIIRATSYGSAKDLDV